MNPLRLTSIQKSFGHHRVVDIDALELNPGELVALLGPSGCGKSTTLRMIAGLEPLDHGQIDLAGVTVADGPRGVPTDKRNVGLVFQDYSLFPHLTVARNIEYGLRRTQDRQTRVHEMITLVGLSGRDHHYPRELSGGQQQRVALARALAPQPSLLLLDEPFSSLDPSLRQNVRADVREILHHSHTTTLLVTHDQEEAFSMADRVAVMLHGQIAQFDTPAIIYQQPVSPAVAAFVGDANFLLGTASNGTIHTPVGDIQHPTHLQGEVTVMIRPEMFRLHPATSGQGTIATVRDLQFFGHDHLITVDLSDGLQIQVRQAGICQVAVGQTVRIEPSNQVMVYPPQHSSS